MSSTKTQLVRVYPSCDRLPENLLRFHFYFSNAMRRGSALQHIHLFNSQNQEVFDVFLDTVEELWDPTTTRLTLLFHPGRVKKGLSAYIKMGRALLVGETYNLVVDQDWLDAQGQPLQSNFSKQFTVVDEYIEILDINTWKVVSPKANTQEPVFIEFPQPLDCVSLITFIYVEDDRRNWIEGEVDLLNYDKTWSFTPMHPWTQGCYTLVVNTRLEDLAGNNLNEPFDRVVGKQPHGVHHRLIDLGFVIL
ncbi:hypothetical protein [Iningainema tapete]|uniref:SbsA Ig-like domain-containing protein n=1 Tax=Iningainema tapete BLCC-T55 TaxID=2748662 RepID=A0A8J6XJ21_9CYAN|nr:hypothetical protein [Iningainema tapete]MBD2777785.1 hypothetical protein [Iningainema tapete BLCC-T55]